MNLGSPGHRCRWVSRRLPLLAGGDLTGADRRKVERHLITCADCRRHEASLADALGLLQTAAGSPAGPEPAGASPPSLWPALSRQIREERHAPRRSGGFTGSVTGLDPWPAVLVDRLWSPPLSFPSWGRAVLALAAGVVLAGLAAGGVEHWARRRADANVAAPSRPIDRFPTPGTSLALDDLVLPPGLNPPAVPADVASAGLASNSPGSTPPAAKPNLDFDLDHGTPMGSDIGDPMASY